MQHTRTAKKISMRPILISLVGSIKSIKFERQSTYKGV